jgi:peptidoglycan/xylan/chitin deacetylase (PgdA/CDA1 family)
MSDREYKVRRIRSSLKILLIAALYYSGFLWLLAALRLRRRIVVLTYHRVLPKAAQANSFSSQAIIVTPATFDLHMRFLRRHMHPISLSELERIIQSGDTPRVGTCLVTFDDGWYDNLAYALPILRRHGIPAVLFVATDYVGTDRCFWQERLARRLHGVRRLPAARALFANLGCPGVDYMDEQEARTAIRDLVTGLKEQPAAVVDELFAELEAYSSDLATAGEDRFLDWADLSTLISDGLFAIGSHGLSHTPLTQLSPDEVRRELAGSRSAIRAGLGIGVSSLAYPNGDASDEVASIARAEGYGVAFTTNRGLVTREHHPQLLPRVNIHEAAAPSRAAFLGRLLGIF